MPPKWLLQHPSGEIMLIQGLQRLPLEEFERVVITVTREQVNAYEADEQVKSAFRGVCDVELVILENSTNGPLETVARTVEQARIVGPVVIKDSDTFVDAPSSLLLSGKNLVVGASLRDFPVTRPESKSYLLSNSQGLINNIVEKNVQSEIFSAGIYGFAEAEEVMSAWQAVQKISSPGSNEMFLSHAISQMILDRSSAFQIVMATDFEDWGTAREWRAVQNSMKTIFIEFEGVLVERLRMHDWSTLEKSTPVIELNMLRLRKLYDDGASVVILTSFDRNAEKLIRDTMMKSGVAPHGIVTNLNFSPRWIVGSSLETSPYPNYVSVPLPENGDLRQYL